jgi:hypothetical protein
MDPSCTYVVCSFYNKSIYIYDFMTWEMVAKATGYVEIVTSVIFSKIFNVTHTHNTYEMSICFIYVSISISIYVCMSLIIIHNWIASPKSVSKWIQTRFDCGLLYHSLRLSATYLRYGQKSRVVSCESLSCLCWFDFIYGETIVC